MYFGISVTSFSASINTLPAKFQMGCEKLPIWSDAQLKKNMIMPLLDFCKSCLPRDKHTLLSNLIHLRFFFGGGGGCLLVLAVPQFLSNCFLRKKHVNSKIRTQVPDELLVNCAHLGAQLSPSIGVRVSLKYHTNQMIAGNWSDPSALLSQMFDKVVLY